MNPERSDTCFLVPLIKDADLLGDELGVLLVHNIADQADANGNSGKPAGWGLPGGGLSLGRDESPIEAVRAEARGEVGLEILSLKEIFGVGRISLRTRRGREFKFFYHDLDKVPEYTLDPRLGGQAHFSHIHIYMGKTDFKDSPLAKLLRQRERSEAIFHHNLLVDGKAYIVDFTEGKYSDEEIAALNIAEQNEIDAIGIFPLSLLKKILALYKDTDLGLDQSQRLMYFTHLNWIDRAINQVDGERRVAIARQKVYEELRVAAAVDNKTGFRRSRSRKKMVADSLA